MSGFRSAQQLAPEAVLQQARALALLASEPLVPADLAAQAVPWAPEALSMARQPVLLAQQSRSAMVSLSAPWRTRQGAQGQEVPQSTKLSP
jgi:hypothetical protein